MGDYSCIGGSALDVERERIDQLMGLFPHIRYQIGGAHPRGHRLICDATDSGIIVWASTKFFCEYPTYKIRENISNGTLKWGNRDLVNFAGCRGYVNLGKGARAAIFLPID